MREIPILYLVVPCYNEQEVVEKTAAVMGEMIYNPDGVFIGAPNV